MGAVLKILLSFLPALSALFLAFLAAANNIAIDLNFLQILASIALISGAVFGAIFSKNSIVLIALFALAIQWIVLGAKFNALQLEFLLNVSALALPLFTAIFAIRKKQDMFSFNAIFNALSTIIFLFVVFVMMITPFHEQFLIYLYTAKDAPLIALGILWAVFLIKAVLDKNPLFYITFGGAATIFVAALEIRLGSRIFAALFFLGGAILPIATLPLIKFKTKKPEKISEKIARGIAEKRIKEIIKKEPLARPMAKPVAKPIATPLAKPIIEERLELEPLPDFAVEPVKVAAQEFAKEPQKEPPKEVEKEPDVFIPITLAPPKTKKFSLKFSPPKINFSRAKNLVKFNKKPFDINSVINFVKNLKNIDIKLLIERVKGLFTPPVKSVVMAHADSKFSNISDLSRKAVILSPSFYWYKKSDTKFKNIMAARRFAASIFYGWIPDNGSYKYYAFREESGWGFIACDPNETARKLADMGIDLNLVSRIYFAQTTLIKGEKAIAVSANSALSFVDGSWVAIPRKFAAKEIAEFSQDYIKLSRPSFAPKRSKTNIETEDDLDRKKFLIAASFLGVLIAANTIGLYRVLSAQNAYEIETEDILQKNKLPATQMQIENIEKRLTKVAEAQEGLRAALSKFLAFSPEAKLEKLEYENRAIAARYLIAEGTEPEAAERKIKNALPAAQTEIQNGKVLATAKW
ncbi:MAG: hypothetical protein LBU73_00900 [Helicobacteraceae bacterium]|jgi:hypothetical protein|nr:hypothetical protein [Helicobacteraceae bacterium]